MSEGIPMKREPIEEDDRPKKRRRTPEELRAHYQEKLKELAEDEKKEVVRLLSGVLDDLNKISTYKHADTIKADLQKLQTAVNGLLAGLNK